MSYWKDHSMTFYYKCINSWSLSLSLSLYIYIYTYICFICEAFVISFSILLTIKSPIAFASAVFWFALFETV